jgi:hypothetical protein
MAKMVAFIVTVPRIVFHEVSDAEYDALIEAHNSDVDLREVNDELVERLEIEFDEGNAWVIGTAILAAKSDMNGPPLDVHPAQRAAFIQAMENAPDNGVW